MIRLLWVLLAGSLFCLRSSAQSRFDSWTIDNGLPQNSVRAILQTRDGYLWFATLNGLVRFDGVRFTVFDKSNTPGIQSNRFTTLFEDREGSLWIDTEEEGLAKYKDGVFTTYQTRVGDLYRSFTPLRGPDGRSLWLLNDEILSLWQNKTPTSSPTQGRLERGGESNPSAFDQELEERRRNGGAAVADAAGLQVFANGRLTTYTTRDGLSSRKIISLSSDGRGGLWFGTQDAGLNRLRDGKFTVWRKKDGLPSDYMKVRASYEDRRGALWFGHPERGLYRLKDGALTHYTSEDGLAGDTVVAIYEDREGSIWIGTSDGGISRFREEIVSTYTRRDGLLADNAYPIYEDRAGGVWVGTWPGLNRYWGGRFTHHPNTDGSPFATVTALYEDREGIFWVGTYGAGVKRLQDGRFTALEGLTSHDANGVLAIHQDRTGTLWFGTTSGLFSYEGGALSHLTTSDGLPHPHVTAIQEDPASGLWLGTRGGLVRLAGETLTAYREKDGLSSDNVRSLHQDETGTLWIGTYDGGLNRFKDGRFTHYTKQDGLFDNGVFQILDDGRGNFWMSSNRGIHRVSRQQLQDFADGKIHALTAVGYGRGDGMLNPECNGGSQPAGARTRDGRLWFPTQQGVAVIDLAAVRPNTLPPPVLIEEFSLDDQSVAFDGGQVQVRPGQTRFGIRYTALSFIKPEQVRFRYKLEGLDEDWVDAGARRTVDYSYVAPGSYTFRVIAANSDGVWNTEGQSLRVRVLPPFYRTWWFVTLAVLGVTAILALGYHRRVRQLEREKTAQQAFSRQLIDSQESERKRIAGELHDSLGQNLLFIKTRALLGLMQPNDGARAVAELGEISTVISQSLDEVRQIAANLHPYHLGRLGLTKAIEAMIRKVAAAAQLDITTEIDNIDGLFDAAAAINLYRIVQESLNNIIKHSAATTAEVIIKRTAQNVVVVITDHGQGFAAAETKSGFGLTGIAERARILGGVHTIDSLPGQGTKLTLTIGLRKT